MTHASKHKQVLMSEICRRYTSLKLFCPLKTSGSLHSFGCTVNIWSRKPPKTCWWDKRIGTLLQLPLHSPPVMISFGRLWKLNGSIDFRLNLYPASRGSARYSVISTYDMGLASKGINTTEKCPQWVSSSFSQITYIIFLDKKKFSQFDPNLLNYFNS